MPKELTIHSLRAVNVRHLLLLLFEKFLGEKGRGLSFYTGTLSSENDIEDDFIEESVVISKI